MQIRALPTGVQRFALDDLAPQRWRNGGGWTRTVATAPDGPAWHWRVSAADIEVDGDFSVFEGLDRTAVLMRGAGLALQGRHERLVFEGVGAKAAFAGETPLRARLAQRPARLWNVMTARGHVQADVQVHRDRRGQVAPLRSAVLVVLDGVLDVSVQGLPVSTLRPDEGLVLRDLAERLDLQAQAGLAQWVLSRFRPCGAAA